MYSGKSQSPIFVIVHVFRADQSTAAAASRISNRGFVADCVSGATIHLAKASEAVGDQWEIQYRYVPVLVLV